MTNEEMKATIIKTLQEKGSPVNPSVIMQKNGWKKDQMDEMCAQFGVKTFMDILKSMSELELAKDEKGTPSVCLKSLRASQAKADTTLSPAPKTEKIFTQQQTLPIAERVKILLAYMNQNLYGKEEPVRLALLSAVANVCIFFLGLPGTAKSMTSRRIACIFKDFYKDDVFDPENGYFEYLMNEFSTPDEICGPVDLSALNAKPSRYTRQTKGYLPSAMVAFLDEIWKSGPAILNTLLTIVNEKVFHNGNVRQKVPLISLAAASNELPQKGRGLEALWDRFVLRIMVKPVENHEELLKIIESDDAELIPNEEQKATMLSAEEVKSWQADIKQVDLSDDAQNIIFAVNKELAKRNAEIREKNKNRAENEQVQEWYISNRRWKKIGHLLKASAFLNGRDTVDAMDCSLIEYAIWDTKEQYEAAPAIMEDILRQYGVNTTSAVGDIGDQIDDFEKKVDTQWFDHVIVKAVAAKYGDKIVKVDGKNCYECTREGTNETWYVTVNKTDSYHNVYNSNLGLFRQYNFSKNGDKINCYYNFTINQVETEPAIPAKNTLEPKLFEPVAKKAVQEAFDTEYYEPLMANITNEIAELEKTKTESAEPFENNAFANQKYTGVLLEIMNNTLVDLQKLKDRAEKQHARYASEANVKSFFGLGDIILQDGTYKQADSKVEGVVAKVCLKGDTTNSAYGIGWKFVTAKTFADAKKWVASYGKEHTLSAPYDTDWQLPTIEQWKQIYANRKDISGLKLEGCYWSSTENEDGSVWYFDIDKGKEDFTTANHQFSVYAVRKLAR